MSMPTTTTKRLTREESRQLTRVRLLDAAERLFVERGFHGTSVEEIAERAGYTRGAFYSNFVDKDDAFLALVDRNLKARIGEINDIFRRAPSLEDAFVIIRRDNEARGGRDVVAWSMLHTEFWLYAMRNPRVRPKLAELYRTERKAFGRAIKAQFDALGLEVPMPLDDAALVLQVIDEGSVRHRPIDPRGVNETFLWDAMLALMDAGAALARERARSQKRSPKS